MTAPTITRVFVVPTESRSFVVAGKTRSFTVPGITGSRPIAPLLAITRDGAAGAGLLAGFITGTEVDLTGSAKGHGVLSAAGRLYSIHSAATLSGSGHLSATAIAKFARSAALTGHGVLSGPDEAEFTRSPALSGSGTLSTTAHATKFVLTAAMSGTGHPSATTKAKVNSLAALPGHGVLTPTAHATKFILTAALPGTGKLTGAAHPKFTSAAALPGHGVLTAIANATKFILTAPLPGAGVLTATAINAVSPVTPIGTNSTDLNTGNGSVTIPSHQTGDIIVIWAMCVLTGGTGGSAVQPPSSGGSVPSWNILNTATASNCAAKLAYAVASGSGDTSGTWTNSTADPIGLVAMVFRGASSSTPIGGHGTDSGTSTNTVSAPGVSMAQTDGTSALAYFLGINNAVEENPSWGTPSAGSRQTANNFTSSTWVTDASSGGGMSQGYSNTDLGNAGYIGATVEIRAH